MLVLGLVDVVHNYLLQHQSIMKPSWEAISFLHQLLDFALKSPNTEIIHGLSSWILSKVSSKFFRKDSNSPLVWLGDLQRQMNLQHFLLILISNVIHSWRYFILLFWKVVCFNINRNFPTFSVRWMIFSNNIVTRYFQIVVIRWTFGVKISFWETRNI